MRVERKSRAPWQARRPSNVQQSTTTSNTPRISPDAPSSQAHHVAAVAEAMMAEARLVGGYQGAALKRMAWAISGGAHG